MWWLRGLAGTLQELIQIHISYLLGHQSAATLQQPTYLPPHMQTDSGRHHACTRKIDMQGTSNVHNDGVG
jgi:hypothetical protein